MNNADKQTLVMLYNNFAENFAESWYKDDLLIPLHKHYLSLFNTTPEILDVGCSIGYESMRLSRLGANVTGIDFSEKAIEIAKKKNPNCTFFQCDFLNLEEDLGKFDGIFVSGFLFHFNDNDIKVVFNNFSKLISQSGYLLLVMKSGNGIKEKSTIINEKTYIRKEYWRTKEDIEILAKQFGFELVNEYCLEKTNIWKNYIYKKLD